jgi:hypothetical protein
VEWINIDELLNYTPDPVRIVVEENEVSAEFFNAHLFYYG